MTPGSYENFDLLIIPIGDHYQARVINSPVGQAAIEFKLPFTEPELRAFAPHQSRLSRHLNLSANEEEASASLDPKIFGEKLCQTIFADGVGKLLVRSMERAQTKGSGLRIRLRMDQAAPELAELPWEYLYVTDWKRFPALSDGTPIIRYVEVDKPERSLEVALPLRILALISNPNDAPPLQVEQEWDRLQRATADLQKQAAIVLERLPSPTFEALQNRLREVDVHILHFIGHGYFDAQHNEGSLIFENEQGASQFVAADTLATLLQDHEALRLIFLNACEGARSGHTDAFAGVAQKLVQQGILAVLAMQFAISDQAAIALSSEFYHALADYYPIDTAVSEARKAIYSTGNSLPRDSASVRTTAEWGTPVLFLRGDGRIIQKPVIATDASLPTTPRWHPIGSVWLASGLLGVILLIGLGYLLLADFPALQNSVLAMVGVLTFLVGFLGLRDDKTFLPKLSQTIGKRRPVQASMAGLLIVSVSLWATLGRRQWCNDAYGALGCPAPGIQRFAIGEWENRTPGASPYDSLWTKRTREVLYDKLSLVDKLQGIALDSPQTATNVSKQLDWWIQGSYQKIDDVELAARLTGKGGVYKQAVTVRNVVDEAHGQVEAQILALQNQLAQEILRGLGIQVSPVMSATIGNTPTRNSEALQKNNQAFDLIAQGADLQEAETLLQTALQLDPHYASPHNNLGTIRVQQHDLPGALAEYQRAIDLLPRNPLYHFNLGETYELLNENHAAIQAYEQALQLDPGYIEAFNNLGFTYLKINELTKAQQQLQKGLALAPDEPYLHKNLGRVYLQQGKAQAAVQELQRAIELTPAGIFAEAYYHLALAQRALGKSAEACQALHEYAPVAPLDAPERANTLPALQAELKCQP